MTKKQTNISSSIKRNESHIETNVLSVPNGVNEWRRSEKKIFPFFSTKTTTFSTTYDTMVQLWHLFFERNTKKTAWSVTRWPEVTDAYPFFLQLEKESLGQNCYEFLSHDHVVNLGKRKRLNVTCGQATQVPLILLSLLFGFFYCSKDLDPID